MHCHCGTNNRATWWTFTDPCETEVRPGAREESASPAWLAAPGMNARDTTKVYIILQRIDTGCGHLSGENIILIDKSILEIIENITVAISLILSLNLYLYPPRHPYIIHRFTYSYLCIHVYRY